MHIDPYTICPGGCNKKIKFCCGKDVSVHLDKILTALSGEQRLSALDLCNSAIDQFGNKACLLALKTNIQFHLSEGEKAAETIALYLQEYPENSVALAMDTINKLATPQPLNPEELNGIVEQLQRCLENLEEVGVSVVLEAIRRVGIALYSAGLLPAARAHLMLYNGFLEEPDEETMRLIMQSNSSPDIPLLLRYDHPIMRCEEETEWADEFNAIVDGTGTGRWLSASEDLTDLDKKYPNQPLIAKTIAILESRLGQPEEMAAAWSQYADTDGVPLDEAVEAEAISQLIDPAVEESGLDIVETAYPVTNMERLLEVMTASERIQALNVDLNKIGGEGPPPKGVYTLLDKAMPDSHENLTFDSVPELIAEMLLFGKQTDRDAMLAVVMTRDEKFDDVHKELLAIVGDCLDADRKVEEVVDTTSKLNQALSWNWRFPPGTPNEFRRELSRQRRQEVLNNVWPDLELDELDGKTPREAAELENYRIPLLGAILLLELSESSIRGEKRDLNPLRSNLGLPTREPIDPSTIENIQALSVAKLEMLEIPKLTDDQLMDVFHLVGMYGVDNPLKDVCEEILKREKLMEEQETNAARLHAILSRVVEDSEEAFEHIHKARDLTIDAGEPVGNVLVAELELRLERGVVDQVGPLLKEIEQRHMREPGVSQNLMRVLMRYGIIGPDGRPRGPMPGANQPVPMEPAAASAGEASAAGSGAGLWTPDGGAASGGESKKLWVPGDD